MKPINKILISADQMSSRRLCPISKYKGPILKLTKFEQEDIKVIRKQIFELEGKAAFYRELTSKNILSSKKVYCCERLDKICRVIDGLREQILNIKKNRLEQQKSGKVKLDFNIR